MAKSRFLIKFVDKDGPMMNIKASDTKEDED